MITYTKGTLKDIEAMQALVAPEVKSGIILERNNDEIATNIRSYILAKESGVLIGFGALHFHTKELGEVRSLIVSDTSRGKGVGKNIVNTILEEAAALEAQKVFALTYKKAFFETLGFVEIPKEELPANKVWTDCIKCKFFPICDEIALIKNI
ncbi:N-acetyltransferase [Sulfurospirillum sp. 1612]|uniref:N-acetyltransferase n=1 Tax=Sulfurospirillum sp. 1612 TaxID=3094835 RepID=UPI002F93B0F7